MPDHGDSEGFDALKARTLTALDKSPKGSVDTALLPLLGIINGHRDHVSTSCCSGRIAVYLPADASEETIPQDSKKVVSGKGGGQWLFVSHDPVPVPSNNDWDPVRLLFNEHTIVERSQVSLDSVQEPFARLKFEPLVRPTNPPSVLHLYSKRGLFRCFM
jgi:tRNA wybutosine-synthesizing protein 3